MHDVLSGRSVTGCFHMANLTPMMWFSKKQATSETETATYGSEFLAARTCIEQIIDLRNSFRYLGVPICETSYVWGDNESQVTSSTFPYARLNKRHNILSYHFVRNMVAKGFIHISHIPSKYNLADILSKHWSHQASYNNLIKPLLNFHSDADDLIESVEISTLAQHGITITPLDDKYDIQLLSTGEFALKDGYAMGSETNRSIESK